MNDSNVYSNIFNNANAMEYLVMNNELIRQIKQLDNYPDTLVSYLLQTAVYTNSQKHDYNLPFYLIINKNAYYGNFVVNTCGGWQPTCNLTVDTTTTIASFSGKGSCLNKYTITYNVPVLSNYSKIYFDINGYIASHPTSGSIAVSFNGNVKRGTPSVYESYVFKGAEEISETYLISLMACDLTDGKSTTFYINSAYAY